MPARAIQRITRVDGLLSKDGSKPCGKKFASSSDSRAASEDLADAAVAGDLSRRLPDSAADRRSSKRPSGSARSKAAWATCCKRWPCSAPASCSNVTIFGLGIMPYISASIIFQLLGSVYPPLEQLQKEGESGPQENQRIHALRHRRSLPGPKLVLRAIRTSRRSTWSMRSFSTMLAACSSAGRSSPC